MVAILLLLTVQFYRRRHVRTGESHVQGLGALPSAPHITAHLDVSRTRTWFHMLRWVFEFEDMGEEDLLSEEPVEVERAAEGRWSFIRC